MGDKVYILRPPSKNLAPKLLTKWLGPYRVIRVLGPVNYEIKEIYGDKIHKTHVNKLKPCKNLILSESNSEESNTEVINDNNNINLNNNDSSNNSDSEIENKLECNNNNNSSEEENPLLQLLIPTTERVVPPQEPVQVIPENPRILTRSQGPAPELPRIYKGRV